MMRFLPQLCNTDSSLHDFYDDDDYNDQPDLTLQNDNSIITFRAGGTDDTDTEGPVSRCTRRRRARTGNL